MTALEAPPAPAAAAYPLPPNRALWRITLHNRAYSVTTQAPQSTGIGELVSARSRRLEQAYNSAAKLTFTLDGRAPEAALISELRHDVIAWRWDDTVGRDRAIFRGPICQSEDQVTEQAHTVNFTAHDYLALLARRYLTAPTPLVFSQIDQDTIVGTLVNRATNQAATGAGTALTPGAYLPLTANAYNPDGTSRPAPSGQLRDRSYLGNQEIGQAIDDLAHVINGFDYDCWPQQGSGQYTGNDMLRLFYPAQGVTRQDHALVYGSNVSGVTRTVDSAAYANYVRVLGNNNNSDQTAPQLYSDAWNSDAITGTAGAIGTWMLAEAAADVSIQSTLDQKAQGDLAYYATLIPSYTLTLRPGWYRYGTPNMGDTVTLVVRSGRLNVATQVRVLGLVYDIGDDGQEDVSLTVGRSPLTLADILAGARADINALSRR